MALSLAATLKLRPTGIVWLGDGHLFFAQDERQVDSYCTV